MVHPNMFRHHLKIELSPMHRYASFAVLLVALVTTITATSFTHAEDAMSVATFKCDSTPSGECHFVLYSSTCKEASAINGKPSLVCTHGFLQEFTVKVGQSKKLDELPADFKQCTIYANQKAAFPACAK